MRPVRRQGRPSPGPLTTDELRAALGDPVLDPELLQRALTHRSFAYENGQIPTNERLEFLGDSVLGVVVTETLYLAHPDFSEGRLAKLRAAVGEPASGKSAALAAMLMPIASPVVNVSSIAGLVAFANLAHYTAAKHGVHVMTETLRLELFDQPVRVTLVAPGMVRTDEFSLTRFDGDRERADAVYAGVPGPLDTGRRTHQRERQYPGEFGLVGFLAPAPAEQHRAAQIEDAS